MSIALALGAVSEVCPAGDDPEYPNEPYEGEPHPSRPVLLVRCMESPFLATLWHPPTRRRLVVTQWSVSPDRPGYVVVLTRRQELRLVADDKIETFVRTKGAKGARTLAAPDIGACMVTDNLQGWIDSTTFRLSRGACGDEVVFDYCLQRGVFVDPGGCDDATPA